MVDNFILGVAGGIIANVAWDGFKAIVRRLR